MNSNAEGNCRWICGWLDVVRGPAVDRSRGMCGMTSLRHGGAHARRSHAPRRLSIFCFPQSRSPSALYLVHAVEPLKEDRGAVRGGVAVSVQARAGGKLVPKGYPLLLHQHLSNQSCGLGGVGLVLRWVARRAKIVDGNAPR